MACDEMGDMGDVIVLSSDSDEEDSDVEALGSWGHFTTKAALPLAAGRVGVDAPNVSVPKGYIDLTDSKWSLSHLKKKRIHSTVPEVVDLTEDNTENVSEELTEYVRSDSFHVKENEENESPTINKQDGNLQPTSSSDPNAPYEDCSSLKQRKKYLDSQNTQKETTKADLCVPVIQLQSLPVLQKYFIEQKPSDCSLFNEHCTPVSLNVYRQEETSNNLRTSFASNGFYTEPPLDEPSQTSPVRKGQLESGGKFKSEQLYSEISQSEDIMDGFHSDMPIPSPSRHLSSEKNVHGPFQRNLPCSNPEKLISDEAETVQFLLSNLSSTQSLATRLTPPKPIDLGCLQQRSPKSQDLMSQNCPVSTSEHTEAEKACKWKTMDIRADESYSSDFLQQNIPNEPSLSGPLSEAMDSRSESWYHGQDQGSDSPRSFFCEEGINGEEINTENRFEMDFRGASREDRHFVCPVTLKKIMSGRAQVLINEKEEDLGSPEMICHHSLNLVNCTIDVKYPEGTLQLLSDLLQPGFYPPKDIIVHLLRDIVLDPLCPHHLCVQAFGLLMKTQRYHIADKKTIPWDWELVTSCMDNQDDSKRQRTEVVRMLLEYTVQTMEDDFRAKCSSSTARHSIAKATLSCDQRFSNVRDVVRWLFSAIIKSTENGESREAARERDEQIRIVYILQRMLSLALEVDCSPTLTSAKLSQELFHMLIGNEPRRPQRAHRMLLLECLQSQLLRCKLLEHLLDYACPVKTPVPMSLSLLLHFLKNCTMEPDPSDGTERWKRWEELVHLLWMLLLSYNKAMKGYLCSTVGKPRDIVGTLVYKQNDMVSKTDVCEAIEAFLSRSKADLGQDLPLHVEESLSYLQDYLLDVCQC